MTGILRILFLLPFGFLAACLAAGAVLVLALAGGPEGWQALRAEFELGQENGLFLVAGSVAGVLVATFVAVPALIVILLAELFRWRSIFIYLGAGILIGFSGSLLPFEELFPELETDMAMLAAAGAVGGFVYWLIAGHNAGFTREPTATAPDPEIPAS